MRKINYFIVFVAALTVFTAPKVGATTIDHQIFSGTCGGGDCFGLTYDLLVTDRGDADSATFDATLKLTGVYTGSMSFIGAVDVKVGDIAAPPDPTLTTAPGGTAGWTTLWLNGQAAGNCLNGVGGFLCSYDTGTNTFAPVTNGQTVDYTWAWNFLLGGGAYSFGHLGVNFTQADDSGRCPGGSCGLLDALQDGQNISISGNGRVPEPESFILVGAGLILLIMVSRRLNRHVQ